MGSSFSKIKNFFGSEPDSEASTRANTKTNAKPIVVTPVRRTHSIDSPRGARALSESNASAAASPKKQKIKRNVRVFVQPFFSPLFLATRAFRLIS
jgi:hypothetical protein